MIDGATIRRIRQLHGHSVRDLAKRLRVSVATVSRWETGKQPCSDDYLQALAAALEVPVEAFLPATGEVDAPQPVITRRLPYFGSVPAGARESWPMPTESVEVLAHVARAGRFVLKVTGDSMEPELTEGDLVVIDPMKTVANSILHFDLEAARTTGPILLCRHNGTPMLKRFAIAPAPCWPAGTPEPKKKGKPIMPMLLPRNPTVEPIAIRQGDELEFIGSVIGMAWRKFPT